MNPDNDIARKIETVKLSLADHLRTAEGDQLKDFEVISVNHRSFSTIVHLKIATSRINKRLVMKTINHHPFNKSITDRENQAVVEYNILEKLYSKFQNVEKCSVPRPIVVIPETETFVMEFVEGNLLADEFRFARYFCPSDKFQILKGHYYNCGRWLRKFQEITQVEPAQVEIFSATIKRCEEKLDLIHEARDRRCPPDLKGKVMGGLVSELNKLRDEKIVTSGRHGDFGNWNIMVHEKGITVFDFLGSQTDSIAVDVLKMLVNFEDEKDFIFYSKRKVDELKKSFLRGYGPLPIIRRPVAVICETLHRVCSLAASVAHLDGIGLHRKVAKHLSFHRHLKWLYADQKELLWVNCLPTCNNME